MIVVTTEEYDVLEEFDQETEEALHEGLAEQIAAAKPPMVAATLDTLHKDVGTVFLISKYDKNDLDRVNGDLIVDATSTRQLAEDLIKEYEEQFPSDGYVILPMKVKVGKPEFEPVKPRPNFDKRK